VRHSLEVYSGDELVFSSDGKWIYPLFELERFLVESPYRPEDLLVVDKVIGKAAATVLVHLGVGRIHAVMMSRLAWDFLKERQIPFDYEELVDRILCRTEQLLADIDDPAEAHGMLKIRAEAAAQGASSNRPTQGGQQ
jgi:zinc transport system ATP-binding protein